MKRFPAPPFIVKVCGITNEEDARLALDAGANAIGFNFYPKSPRYIEPERAGEILERLPGDFLCAGVFVNPSAEELERIVTIVRCDVVQLHGQSCPNRAPDTCRLWRCLTAFSVPPQSDASVDAYLLDADSPGFGGSGKMIDWELAALFPYRKIIAGGLDAANVAAAIATTAPNGVDACSRLEARPGKKDPVRVRSYVREALAAAHALITGGKR
jgi:phosphoribosylanthranilate isomerase